MHYYRIPQVARQIKEAVLLRNLYDLAVRRGRIADERSCSTDLIEGPLIDALFIAVLAQKVEAESVQKASDIAAGRARRSGGADGAGGVGGAGDGLVHGGAARSDEERKTWRSGLVAYAHANLLSPVVNWSEQRLNPEWATPGAKTAIGVLYRELHADVWYWALVETLIKLLLTGVLKFIAPGTAGQIFSGMSIAFLSLLFYQYALPFADKGVRQIAFNATLVLFLFFLTALLIKSGVPITDNDNLFCA